MKAPLTTLFLVIAICGSVPADIVYDIHYEPPIYTNGQQIGGGSGRTISDSINGFSSQGVLLHDGAGGGLSYHASDPFTSGIHRVTWEISVPVEQSSSMIVNAQLDSLSGPVLFDTTLGIGPSGYEIMYGDLFPTPRPGISFSIGQAYSFEVLMDLDANYYSFWVDGGLLEDHVAVPVDAELSLVGFAQNQTMGLQAGIDNFRWEVIPEPSSFLLLLSGGSLVLTWWRRNRCA